MPRQNKNKSSKNAIVKKGILGNENSGTIAGLIITKKGVVYMKNN